jgi:hypothetical protein
MSGVNLGWDTGNPDHRIWWFFPVIPGSSQDNISGCGHSFPNYLNSLAISLSMVYIYW